MAETPAYAYGRFLREWRDAWLTFAEHVVAGFEGRPLPHRLTPIGQREADSIARYEQRIAQERRKGLAFVAATAGRVERELGLAGRRG